MEWKYYILSKVPKFVLFIPSLLTETLAEWCKIKSNRKKNLHQPSILNLPSCREPGLVILWHVLVVVWMGLNHQNTHTQAHTVLHRRPFVPLFARSAWVSNRHLNLHYGSRHIGLSCGFVWGRHHIWRKPQAELNVNGRLYASLVNAARCPLHFPDKLLKESEKSAL